MVETATRRTKLRLSWQYAFALICFALAIAAFVFRPSPWFFVPPLVMGAVLGLAGRRAKKLDAGLELPLAGGSAASAHVKAEFPDGEEERES